MKLPSDSDISRDDDTTYVLVEYHVSLINDDSE